MQSSISKIIIALIVGIVLAAMVGLMWFFFFSSPSTQAPTDTTAQTNGLGNNQSTVTNNQNGDTNQTQTQTQTIVDTEAAYRALFSQILGTEAVFVEATATSTGDLKSLYSLYAKDVAGDQKAYPQGGIFPIDIALVDLTDDSKPEAIVYENLPSYCGSGGCTIDIYKKVGSTWNKIFTTSGGGVIGLSNTLTTGYLDLYLTVGSGATVDRYVWDGSTYQFKEVMAIWNGSTFAPVQ